MYGRMKEHLTQTLAEIREAGLYKEERLIESPQRAAIQVKGQEVLNFCANNYLGLSDHPRLIEASKKMRRQLSLIISRPRIRFSMRPVLMRTVVCLNPCSPKRMPSSLMR